VASEQGKEEHGCMHRLLYFTLSRLQMIQAVFLMTRLCWALGFSCMHCVSHGCCSRYYVLAIFLCLKQHKIRDAHLMQSKHDAARQS
jgi:hypothetical protein